MRDPVFYAPIALTLLKIQNSIDYYDNKYKVFNDLKLRKMDTRECLAARIEKTSVGEEKGLSLDLCERLGKRGFASYEVGIFISHHQADAI